MAPTYAAITDGRGVIEVGWSFDIPPERMKDIDKQASANSPGPTHTKGRIDHYRACRSRRDINEERKRGQDLQSHQRQVVPNCGVRCVEGQGFHDCGR